MTARPKRRSRPSRRGSRSSRSATRRRPHHGDAWGKKAAETTPEFEHKFAEFMSAAQHMIDQHSNEFFKEARAKTGDPTFGAVRLTAERGPRYIRIVRNDVFENQMRPGSVYVFVDTTNGNILKAASFRTPAKHARGNIFDPDPLKAVTVYGGQYLR